MSNCCAKKPDENKRHTCPENKTAYGKVPYQTVLLHIKEAWKSNIKEQAYYFCDAPDCEVVYFAADNSIIKKDQLKTKVGIKETSDDALICYCFDVSRIVAQTDSTAKEFVIEKTKHALCSCQTQNPSGKCCLKDFPKLN